VTLSTPPRADEVQAKAAAILKARQRGGAALRKVDICDWGERNFWIVDEESKITTLIKLSLTQKAALRYSFTRRADGHYPCTNILYSTPKKGGKSTVAALAARYVVETQTRMGECYFAGNDLEQAKERSFKFLVDSVRLTPGCVQSGGVWVLPGRWELQKTRGECLTTGTAVKAISVDARGEAGANPDITLFTELWAYKLPDAVRFFVEMTPPPTKPDGIRLIESYAGHDGESQLLQGFYDQGLAGRQLTNGELASAVSRPNVPGESYDDFLWAFKETEGDPEALTPIWVNDIASLFMYWDDGPTARSRITWQSPERMAQYYRAQEATLPPNENDRIHYNYWVGAVGAYVPIEWWDDCYDPDLPGLEPGDQTPVVLAADAAVTQDCFGVVMVSRYPDPALHATHVAVHAAKKWDPKESGGAIDLRDPENFIRTICRGGCIMFHPLQIDGSPSDPDNCASCQGGAIMPKYNVKQLPYDPAQMASIAQNLIRERVVWAEPFVQGADRAMADSALRRMISKREIRHTCAPPGHPKHDPDHPLMALRQHLLNANAKLETDQDSKIRIVKKSPDRKIDLAVALAMAVARCRYLRL
jgi:phage terminase large subunit-like protein